MGFDSQVLRLQKWTPNFSTEKEVQSHAVVWVRFPSLNLEYWQVRSLLAMGRPSPVDETTAKRELGYFASVFLDIDLSKSIPDKLWIESKKYGIGFWHKGCAGKDSLFLQSLQEFMVGTVTGSTTAEKPMSKSQKKKWRKKHNKSNEVPDGSTIVELQALLIVVNEEASNPVIAVSGEGCTLTADEVVTTQSLPTVANNSGMIECSIDRNASIVNHYSSPGDDNTATHYSPQIMIDGGDFFIDLHGANANAPVLQSKHVLGVNGNGEESATPEELLNVVVSDTFETQEVVPVVQTLTTSVSMEAAAPQGQVVSKAG
ncbi:hypothetical protein IFM89_034233 [Coptis chinensis]|uniref:DUF4283 domain-containing protein n=1 Tax=Coptis chinensis TaxID=261450 RepID=A0A835LPB6_9MAGN|nr:hypothetical protein IFM89_034233 [Coptis chinensis]